MKSVRELDFIADAGKFVDYNGVTILDKVWKITEENPVKGFPLAVYQFFHNAKYFQLGSKFFDRPTESMLEEFNEIRRKGRDERKFMMHYSVMVYTAVNGNSINLQDRSIVMGVSKITDAIYGETIKLNKCHIQDTVDELKGSYLISIPNQNSYRFHHPTLYESVILSFAHTDDEHFKEIVPLLSWSFIWKMVKSDAYIEQEGELVLKIPTNCYKPLAYRLVDIYRSEFREGRSNIYKFLNGVVETELIQHKTGLLLNFVLEALEIEYDKQDKDKNIEVMSFHDHVHMMNKSYFLGNLLVSAAETENQNETYNCILRKFNQIVKTINNFDAIDFFKSALRLSIYTICSTKDVRCVEATLDFVKEYKMPAILNLGINLTKLEPHNYFIMMPVYNLSATNSIFISFCIWKAYEAFNEPVLEYLLSKYNETPFDVNSFFNLIYREKKFSSLSHKSLKWMIERFIDKGLVETDITLKIACQCHLSDIVKYLAPRCNTFDAILCLKIFLSKSDNDFHLRHVPDFNEDLYNFLFSQIDITSPEMNSIVISILQKPCVPNYVCETILPICIDNEELLISACKEGHFYITKLILEKSQNVNIQSALTSACMIRSWKPSKSYLQDGKLEIVKYIVEKFGYVQFSMKDACQQAYHYELFKIIEWFVLNIDTTLLDMNCIINSALVDKKAELLENIINKTDIASLNKMEVLKSVTEHFDVGCSTQILHLVSIIWASTDDKEEIKIEEVVEMAFKKECFVILMWIHENCSTYVSLDAKKLWVLACKSDRFDVANWILKNKPSLGIDERTLFILTFDTISDTKYWTKTKPMMNWSLQTFQVKPSDLKSCALKYLSSINDSYFPRESYDDLFTLVVSLLQKCSGILSSEDIEVIMTNFLEQKLYDLVNWYLKNMLLFSFDKQKILDKACADAAVETILILNDCFHSLDLHQSLIHACTGSDRHQVMVCKYVLQQMCLDSLDTNRIVSSVCKKDVRDDVMAWIFFNLAYDQMYINKVFISCCRQGKFNLVKYIFDTVDNEQLPISSAFVEACLYQNQWIVTEKENLCVVDFLFQKLPDKLSSLSLVLNELLKMKDYDVILYFLEEGYCRNIDMKNLLIEVCRTEHHHVKLLQWIFENVDHKELDIKSAFLAACKNFDSEWQLHCLSLMWHYIHDINVIEVDIALNTMTEAPPYTSEEYDNLRNWLLYIKKINQRETS